jgi:hypothetical protein
VWLVLTAVRQVDRFVHQTQHTGICRDFKLNELLKVLLTKTKCEDIYNTFKTYATENMYLYTYFFFFFFFLWLYSRRLDLGRLHETFRVMSVTRSRTVSSIPWTGDQLVARTAPGDCDDDEVGGVNGFDREHRSTRRKPAPTPLCQPQIPLVRPGLEPGPPRWEASN